MASAEPKRSKPLTGSQWKWHWLSRLGMGIEMGSLPALISSVIGGSFLLMSHLTKQRGSSTSSSNNNKNNKYLPENAIIINALPGWLAMTFRDDDRRRSL